VTPKRRQGSGRAAVDHIAAQLTDALSELSRVQASQAAIADAARNDRERLVELLDRLDDDLLVAVTCAAELLVQEGRQLIGIRRVPERNSP
jgi:hypothetical protein